MRVVIAGGAGELGQRVARDLIGRRDDVVVLTRSPAPIGFGRPVRWDGATAGPWLAELGGAAGRIRTTPSR